MSTPLEIMDYESKKLKRQNSRDQEVRHEQASKWLSEEGAYFSREDAKSMKDFLKANSKLIKDDSQDISSYLNDTKEITVKPKKNNVNINTEIIRTNFIINYSPSVEQVELENTEIYLDNALNRLPEALEFEKVSDAIGKMKNVTKVVRNFKTYHQPNWFKKRDRKDMEMHVKQLNRLSTRVAKAPLNGTQAPSTKFTDSLSALIKFQGSTEEDEKEGFFQGGITLDELNQLRRKLSQEAPNKTVYSSISDNRILTYDKYGFVTYHVDFIGKPFYLPRVTLGNINAPSRTISKNGDGSWGEVIREQFKHKVYNTSVEALLRRAPDFRQNMFLGMFVFTTSDGGQIQEFNDLTNSINGFTEDKTIHLNTNSTDKRMITKLMSSYEKTLSAYYVRMQNIEVPGANIESYDVPFLNRNIKKLHSNFTEKHKITINFTVDELGLIIRNFNLLTGQFGNRADTQADDKHNMFADTLFPVEFSTNNKGKLDLVVTYNDFRINENNGGFGFHKTSTLGKMGNAVASFLKEANGQGSGVHSSAYMPASQNVQSEFDDVVSRDGSQVWGDPASYRQFIFEDVKILGFTGELKFNRDAAGKMTVPLDIIFKRITTVDNNRAD